MHRIRTITDIEDCRRLWEEHIPRKHITDLWEVRLCFQQHYRHRPYFLAAEDRSGICGLLPLSWSEETGKLHCFPGETWGGKTWLEQNRMVAKDNGILDSLMENIPYPYHLRYLLPFDGMPAACAVDEINYNFLPSRYDYSMDRYFGEFSHKSYKRLKKTLDEFEVLGLNYRYNVLTDFDTLVEMNLSRFGTSSYFDDFRFRKSFECLLYLLHDRGWLRLTTVLVGGRPAAVDMGCLYDNVYTLLAGGTGAEHPGIAKLINLHHMRWACETGIKRVDFLCGDFHWKTQFHLEQAPLYLLSGEGASSTCQDVYVGEHAKPDRARILPGKTDHA
jgi:hypothetical protein